MIHYCLMRFWCRTSVVGMQGHRSLDEKNYLDETVLSKQVGLEIRTGVKKMSNYSVQTKHVSHKISKVRWRPLGSSNSDLPTTFLTGGCDNNDENILALWLSPAPERTMADDMEQADDEPIFICSSSQKGDVTDLLFLNGSTFFSSSSNGDLNVFEYSQEFQVLRLKHNWSKLHNSSINGISAVPGAEMVATVGKEGRINLLHQPLTRPDALPTVVADAACHTTPNAIKFLQRSSLALVNNAGQLTIWDAGANKSHPAKVFELLNNAVPFLSLDQHPSRSHIVVAGAEDGGLYVWDLRNEGKPVAIHRGHACDVLEVKFHADLPNNLFTCSEDGSLWHWGSNDSGVSALFNDVTKLGQSPGERSQVDTASHWLLNNETSKGRVIINDMLSGNSSPVNSLDVIGNRLVSGLDGDQLFVFSDLVIC